MEKFYVTLSQLLQTHPRYRQIIKIVGHFASYVVAFVYGCILLYMMVIHHPLLIETIIKPLIAFVLVTVFRKIVNRPRPYDAYDIESVEPHKHGQSFPSRHSVSAIIIALVCLKVNVTLGMIMTLLAIIVVSTRLLGCLHFVSDVVAALVIALIINMF